MKYYGLALQPMQESGAFLLRAMQNEEMPRLDLLVRESVQNALDAGHSRSQSTPVKVDFNILKQATHEIAEIFTDGIDLDTLNNRYPDQTMLLEVRDSLTEGLTGPLTFGSVEDDASHGNLLKLVFEIGRTRNDDGAGGSWGLGKTCYFRMGAGLVIYYSRIKFRDRFEERLVASLVEDETRSDCLQISSRTGIAWWGAAEELRPVTCQDQIHKTLKKLGISPFLEEETGTSVIIPFLREDLLPVFDQDHGTRPWWYQSYDAYIRIALQRWFCVRIDNRAFLDGPYLAASVNGAPLLKHQMLPIFKSTQSLYNRVADKDVSRHDYLNQQGVKAENVVRKDIYLRNEFLGSGSAGHLVAALMTSEQLGMGAPDNIPSPGLCIFGRPENTTPYRPIITFMRRPGMNICWDDSIDSRGWNGGFSGSADGLHMIALFVPRSNRQLLNPDKRHLAGATQNLEGYLRSCERADHAAWVDISGMRIVEKIRTACGKIVKDFGLKPIKTVSVKPSIRMARNLADLLLPSRGFGADGRGGPPASPAKPIRTECGPNRKSIPSPELDIYKVGYVEEGIAVSWTLVWGAIEESCPREILLAVDSESGPISPELWTKNGLGTFPFRLSDLAFAEAFKVDAKLKDAASGPASVMHMYPRKVDDRPHSISGHFVVNFVTPSGSTLRPILIVAISKEAEVGRE